MSDAPKAQIEVHQTVHGYRDGHELLSSLTQFPPSARRAMLVLSDLSGDGAVRGFTEYLTGYPLDEPALYAFARTWYAPEMPRPGCVWTHTLLVSFGDLAQLSGLSDLCRYFRRPQEGDQAFAHNVIAHPLTDTAPRLGPSITPSCAELVEALYRDDSPVVVPADDSSQHANLVLALYAQQWPRLRRVFTFCTGSLDSRSLDRRPFDLQIVPRSRARRIARTLDHCTLVDLGGESSTPQPQASPDVSEWAEVAAKHLDMSSTAFREWLKRFGADVKTERRSFSALTRCYVEFENQRCSKPSGRNLIRTLADSFPDPDEACALKTSLLGDAELLPAPDGESDLIQELLVSPDVVAFNRVQNAVFRRAEKAWRKDGRWRQNELVWLLTNDGLNEFGRKLADRATADLVPEDLIHIFASSRGTFVRLVAKRPELAANQWLWRQSSEVQRAALDSLEHISANARMAVIDAMRDASAVSAVDEFVDRESNAAIDLIMSSIHRCYTAGSELDETRWQSLVNHRESLIVTWLQEAAELDPRVVRFVAMVWGPSSTGVRRLGNEFFSGALARAVSGSCTDVADDLAAFCLALGLSTWNSAAIGLVHDTFQRVHDAVMQSRLSGKAWQWLSRTVPGPGWFATQDWDRGEKLRRALVDAFVRNGWDPHVFALTVRSPDTRRRVMVYCRDSRRGKELLRASGLLSHEDGD